MTTTRLSTGTIQACSCEMESSVTQIWHFEGSVPISTPDLVILNFWPDSEPEVTCTFPKVCSAAGGGGGNSERAAVSGRVAAMCGPPPTTTACGAAVLPRIRRNAATITTRPTAE